MGDIQEVARLKANYDMDVLWDEGCNGSDFVPHAEAYDAEGPSPELPGERFEIVVADDGTDIYVDVNPSENDGYDYNVSWNDRTLYYMNKEDGGWYKPSSTISLSNFAEVSEDKESYLLYAHDIALQDADFRACLQRSNPEAFEIPAVKAFFESFDITVGNIQADSEEMIKKGEREAYKSMFTRGR